MISGVEFSKAFFSRNCVKKSINLARRIIIKRNAAHPHPLMQTRVSEAEATVIEAPRRGRQRRQRDASQLRQPVLLVPGSPVRQSRVREKSPGITWGTWGAVWSSRDRSWSCIVVGSNGIVMSTACRNIFRGGFLFAIFFFGGVGRNVRTWNIFFIN